MWSTLLGVARRVITLGEDLRRYESELKNIRKELRDLSQELRDLSLVVQLLVQEFRHSQERVDSERARLLLEVENRLLRMNKGLPAADQRSDSEAD
ncbi:MAG TPA: hypothetical protein VF546_23790 [Pyrinomonadaceae bacterium]|jgi:predicted  nucleic acid-binding Zn-ribbon protein